MADDAVAYAMEDPLSAAEFIDILQRSGLGPRHPVDDTPRIETMLKNADLVITTRNGDGLLIGISRCITDFAYCFYCSDLAVDKAREGEGIGL